MGTYDGSPKSRGSSPSVMYFLVGLGLFALGYFVHGTVSPRAGNKASYSSVDTEKMLASIKGDLVELYERTQCMPIMVIPYAHPRCHKVCVHNHAMLSSGCLLGCQLLVKPESCNSDSAVVLDFWLVF